MKLRKITALILLFSFSVMVYTGVMLFVSPEDTVSHWSNWKFLGLSKPQYGELHTTFMVLFAFFGILHIYLNWNSILNYLKDASQKISFTKKELIVALVINIFFFFGTLHYIQPFRMYFGLYEDAKIYWAKEYGRPPYKDAEESSLKTLCTRIGIDTQSAFSALKTKGIKIDDPNQTLKDIASKNNLAPRDVYVAIKSHSAK